MCANCKYYQDMVILPKFKPPMCLLSGKKIFSEQQDCWGFRERGDEA